MLFKQLLWHNFAYILWILIIFDFIFHICIHHVCYCCCCYCYFYGLCALSPNLLIRELKWMSESVEQEMLYVCLCVHKNHTVRMCEGVGVCDCYMDVDSFSFYMQFIHMFFDSELCNNVCFLCSAPLLLFGSLVVCLRFHVIAFKLALSHILVFGCLFLFSSFMAYSLVYVIVGGRIREREREHKRSNVANSNRSSDGGWRLCPIFIVPALAWDTERHFNFERMCVKIKTSHQGHIIYSKSRFACALFFYGANVVVNRLWSWNAIFLTSID